MIADIQSSMLAAFPSTNASGSGFAVRPQRAWTVPVGERAANRGLTKNAAIMIVDDALTNIKVVRKHLQTVGYENFLTTEDSTAAFDMMRRAQPDLVLLDVMMPQVSGLDILRQMRSDERLCHVPVLILTAATDAKTKVEALELGATDFLAKPVDPNELVPRVRNALIVKAHQDHLSSYSEQLEREVQLRTAELATSRQEVIHCLARAAEYRDDDTGMHVVRVGRYAAVIARELGFSEDHVRLLEQAAQLHDVGKIGIPDSILLKPGKLDPEEFELMQNHCGFGKSIIQPLAEKERTFLRNHTELGAKIMTVPSSPVLMLAARIAQTHHEKWNGTGYPLGLKGEDIPLEGRITAVADVFDALSSKRPYKPPFPREKCFAILEEGRGTHFDPRVLDAFFARSAQIIEVQIDCADRG
jgi:putative two-component system response regulator